jgi:glycosyltransferase involved in cell wall biosynthesis
MSSNFLVITHVRHKSSNDIVAAYGPYVREMNLWLHQVETVRVVASISDAQFGPIDLPYEHPNLDMSPVPAFDLNGFGRILRTIGVLPILLLKLFVGMCWADHIHLRCPGNMGLLGCLVQVLFPWKKKSAKYAGNWDWNSRQPWSYRLQQWLLRNPLLTHNMQALVYGEWPDRTRNVLPFFTATYHEAEIEPLETRILEGEIRLVFVGGLTAGKRPLLAVQAAEALLQKGHRVSLELLGEGAERQRLENYIEEHGLRKQVRLLGNVDAEKVKKKLQGGHFLIFVSKSEGWPKAVAEAMFWGCLPITTAVSCVPYMLDFGKRGTLIAPEMTAAVQAVEAYMENPQEYSQQVVAAAEWSRQFTLEKFEEAIKGVLRG